MIPCRIEVVMKGGARKTVSIERPRGHFKNPMSGNEVEAKFRPLAQRVLPRAQTDRAVGESGEGSWNPE